MHLGLARANLPAYAHLKLKENFRLWVHQATSDFSYLTSQEDPALLRESLSKHFAIDITNQRLATTLGISASPAIHTKPTRDIENIESKPWSTGE